MSSPFLTTSTETTTSTIKVNNLSSDVIGNIIITLSSLPDVNLFNIKDQDSLIFDVTSSKWVNGESKQLLLATLGDIDLSNLSDQQILQYNMALNKWINTNMNSATNISNLGDCVISNASNGQILMYNSTLNKWTNSNATLRTSLSNLLDCSILNPVQNGQVLVYNTLSGTWCNSTQTPPSLISLSDVSISSPLNNQVILWNNGKWNAGALSSALLSDFNISGVLNDQILVYSNKWTPYTLTGVTFNDTTKTITVVGGTSVLAGLSDVTILSPSNNQVLTYSNSKWINQSIPNMSLVSLSDVSISGQTNNQVILWNSSTSKWNAGTLSSSFLSDFSTSGVLNDQILVYNSNKWTPYTLTGVTFNDTTKTISVSGTTALAGLTTDVTISSPSNNQVLTYSNSKWINSSIPNMSLVSLSDVSISSQVNNQVILWNNSTSKWNNSNLSSSLLNDFSISSPANNQVIQYNSTTGKWSNSVVSVYLNSLLDCLISSPVNGQLLQYNGTNWVNSTPTQQINTNETSTLNQMYSIFGGGIGGSGIVQNSYFTVPSYVDNSLNSTILTSYQASPSSNYINLVSFTKSANNINVEVVSNNMISFITFKAYTSGWSRYNLDFGAPYSICQVGVGGNIPTPLTVYIYGSNSVSSYNDISTGSMGDVNLVSLGFTTNISNSTVQTLFSTDTTNAYRYLIIFCYMATGTYVTGGIWAKTGVNTPLILSYGSDYSIDADPSNGNPRIKNLKSSTIQGYYNNLAIIWNELGRRIYPVVRDTNTILLSNGTTTQTLTSNVGYPLSKCSDTSITSPQIGSLLQYNGTSWVNVATKNITVNDVNNTPYTISVIQVVT